MLKPRAYTEAECREMFLDHIRQMVDYWEQVPEKTLRRSLEGIAFSILVALDGEADLPVFKVIPQPHLGDKTYHQNMGTNWWPDDVNISGSLHEEFYKEEKP